MSWLLDMGGDDDFASFGGKKGKKKKKGNNPGKKKPRKGRKNVKNVKDLFDGIKREEERERKKRISRNKKIVELQAVKDIEPMDKTICIFPLRVCECYPEGGGTVGDETGTINIKVKKQLNLGRYVQVTFRCQKRNYQNRDYSYYTNFRVLEEWTNPRYKKRVMKGCYLVLFDRESEEILMEKSRSTTDFNNFRYLLRTFMNKNQGQFLQQQEQQSEVGKRKKVNVNYFRKEIKKIGTWTNEELDAVAKFKVSIIFPFIKSKGKAETWEQIFDTFLKFVRESCQKELETREEKKIVITNERYDCFCGSIQYNFDEKRMEKNEETALRVFEEKMKKNQYEYSEAALQVSECKNLKNANINDFCFVKIFYCVVNSKNIISEQIIASTDYEEEEEGEDDPNEKDDVIKEPKKKSFVMNELEWIKISDVKGMDNVPNCIKDNVEEILAKETKKKE